LFGIGAGLIYGVQNGPKPRSGTTKDKLTDPPHQVRTFVGLLLLTLLLTVPGAFLSANTDDLSRGEAITWAVTFVVTGPVVFAGWFIKRRLARRKAWYRFTRAVAGAGIWAVMALAPAIFAVGVLPFQTAQVCVQETGDEPTLLGKETPLTLVAQTGDRTILAVEKTDVDGKAKSILSLPTSKITRLQFGELDAAGMNCTGDPGAGARTRARA
jgi:hypothetical protein